VNNPVPVQLEANDIRLIRAAEGWLELNLPAEAEAELAQLSPDAQAHPLVLKALWQLHVYQHQWGLAHTVAELLVQTLPDDVDGWVHRAYAARRKDGGGIQVAWDALRPAVDRFPDESIIPYNLACYACQMGNLDAARHWLGRARVVAGKHQTREGLKHLALSDPDLAPLHGEIAVW
jgi:Flp pilus assembly protein TadD